MIVRLIIVLVLLAHFLGHVIYSCLTYSEWIDKIMMSYCLFFFLLGAEFAVFMSFWLIVQCAIFVLDGDN